MEMLNPFVERLPAMLTMLKKQTVPVGARTLAVKPWEIGLLGQLYKGELDPVPAWSDLVARGLALQIKVLQDLDARGGTVPVDPADPVMKADLEAGQVLLAELQAAVNALIAKGEKEHFKHLSAFRRTLYDLFFELKHGKQE
jgi:hypothetical protein